MHSIQSLARQGSADAQHEATHCWCVCCHSCWNHSWLLETAFAILNSFSSFFQLRISYSNLQRVNNIHFLNTVSTACLINPYWQIRDRRFRPKVIFPLTAVTESETGSGRTPNSCPLLIRPPHIDTQHTLTEIIHLLCLTYVCL